MDFDDGDDGFDDPDPGSSSSSSALAVFGTPLPEIDDEAQVKKKPIAIEDQIVTDEQGRRRFHGAFTGGFSAGFYNTAGSRDGWSPAHFKSSRSSKAADTTSTARAQRPEDFMDKEDLGEFGIAPQGLKTSAQFRRPKEKEDQRKRNREEREREERQGPIPGEPVLEQVK